jgi:hypothetical protein
MTTVGKILVILNLVFSFVVGFLAIQTYTARTHWATKYTELTNRFKVVDATANTYRNEADRLTREREALNQQLYAAGKKELQLKDMKQPEEAVKEAARAADEAIKLLAQRNKEIASLKLKMEDVARERDAANRAIVEYKATTTTSGEAVKRRDLDVDTMRKTLDKEVARNNELVKDMNDLRDRAVAAEINARGLKDMNARLEEQLQDLARDMARVRQTTTTASGVARRTNPPPDDVEGLVRRVDGNLVSITIGSDAGLAKNQTLEVFRFGATPRYIGRIKIVEVTPTQAVGQIQGKLTTPVRAGDTVASNVMGRR